MSKYAGARPVPWFTQNGSRNKLKQARTPRKIMHTGSYLSQQFSPLLHFSSLISLRHARLLRTLRTLRNNLPFGFDAVHRSQTNALGPHSSRIYGNVESYFAQTCPHANQIAQRSLVLPQHLQGWTSVGYRPGVVVAAMADGYIHVQFFY